jgi:alkaline phosphatase D
MPPGLQVDDGTDEAGRPRWENAANGDRPVLGRELEIADILSYIKGQRIQNVVWLTADVHSCAAHYYDPGAAQFKDFDPFREFVSGPLNAGSFGPNALDDSFGPQLAFEKSPPAANFSPFAGLQFFGQVDIGGNGVMTVSLKDINRATVFSQKLDPSSRIRP